MAQHEYKLQNIGNVISAPEINFPRDQGIGTILFKQLSENKQVIGQIDGITGEKDTFGSMLQRSIRTAIAMRSRGITKEDIVTICSYNHLDTNIPILASFFLGVKTASTDPSVSLSDTAYLFNQVKPKIIFVSPNAVELIEKVIKQIGLGAEIVVFGDSDKHTKFSEFLLESTEEEDFRPVQVANIKETAIIFFSSGTSGLPKGICLSHLALLAQIPHHTYLPDITSSLFLSYSSPCWVSSLLFLTTTIVTKGCRLVVPRFDVNDFWNLIDKYKVLMLYLVSSQLIELVSVEQPKNTNTSSLALVATGGACLSKEQICTAREIFPTALVSMGFGQTELGGGVLMFNIGSNAEELTLAIEKPTSSGRPLPGRTYKIVDPETEQILGANQEGELRVKTEYQMNGYYNIDSSKEWDSDGFLKTGDIAYYDEDYCFYIVDRIKELLKFKNHHISPAKLEAILMNHPAVACAVVIGIPHPLDGDHPTGIVVLKKDKMYSNVTGEQIREYFDERVDDDKQKLRGGVRIVESLPVTQTGKFSRRHAKNLIVKAKL